MKSAQNPWKNRITGTGEESPDQLLANPMNWRVHPKQQQEALEAALGEVGWVQNVIVNTRTGHVVDGHLRVSLALRREEKTVPVVYVDLSEGEEALILATIDPLSALAATDKGKLDELLRQVETGSAELQKMLAELAVDNGLTYGAEAEGVDAEPQIDRAAELQEQWKTERGQIWQLGNHRLMCGDSTSSQDLARLMDGQKAQMVFTDPPYGVNYTGGAKERESIENDHVGTDIYGLALPNLRTAADDEAPLYLWYADGHAAAAAAAAAGYQITAQIIWAKNHAQFVTSAHYKGKHEPCYYAHRKGKSARWHGPNNEVTLWECDRSASNDFHPTQKPVELAVRAIKNSTQSGDIVLDLFCGGGTTLMASEQLSRRAFCLEIEPKYVAVCLQRFQDATGKEPSLINVAALAAS